VEAVFREERGRLLAALAARFGDLDLAEEVAQEAIEAALTRWPVDGVPTAPLAWLLTTARRKAVDRIRRDQSYARRLAVLAAETDRVASPPTGGAAGELPDERLTLVFTCCHPALPLEAQVALTLRFVAGMSTAEVAAAFLVPVPTMQQRILRAKRKIVQARIPFRVPEGEELRARLRAALTVVYLVFTEGYASTSGDELVRAELTDEAIRLARILHGCLPDEHEVTGLLALLLLTDARRPARTDPDGLPVSLEDQDRRRWDTGKIDEGRALLTHALAAPAVGPYAVQAAIAALHDEAPDAAATDWPQIIALYDLLLALTPSPLVRLNRAVAVAMRDGPAAGLALMDEIREAPELRGYHHLTAARADLLRRLGRHADAAQAYREALQLVGNQPDRAYLARRLRLLELGEGSHTAAAELSRKGTENEADGQPERKAERGGEGEARGAAGAGAWPRDR
jgi:RNA polymerase sigma-70 factor (ECF subfamily)